MDKVLKIFDKFLKEGFVLDKRSLVDEVLGETYVTDPALWDEIKFILDDIIWIKLRAKGMNKKPHEAEVLMFDLKYDI